MGVSSFSHRHLPRKFRTYVYANGALLAWQQVTYLNGTVYYQGPVWEHRDASNASYRVAGPTTSDPDSAAELDPFNSNMGLTNPYQFPADPPPPHKPNIFYPGFSSGSNVLCRVNAVDTPCGEAFRQSDARVGSISFVGFPGDIEGSVPIYEPIEVYDPDTYEPDPAQPGAITVRAHSHYELVPRGVRTISVQLKQPQKQNKTVTDAVSRVRGILSAENSCTTYFGPNALRALGELEKRLTVGYPEGLGNTKLGIRMSGIQSTFEQPVQFRMFEQAVINLAGPFFNPLSQSRIGGYRPASNQSQVLQIIHELAHAIYKDGKTLIPNDDSERNPGKSEKNTDEILKHCKGEIEKVKN